MNEAMKRKLVLGALLAALSPSPALSLDLGGGIDVDVDVGSSGASVEASIGGAEAEASVGGGGAEVEVSLGGSGAGGTGSNPGSGGTPPGTVTATDAPGITATGPAAAQALKYKHLVGMVLISRDRKPLGTIREIRDVRGNRLLVAVDLNDRLHSRHDRVLVLIRPNQARDFYVRHSLTLQKFMAQVTG